MIKLSGVHLLYGYIVYLLMILLPGLTLTLILRMNKNALSEYIALAASLGISFNIVLLSLLQVIINEINIIYIYSIIILSTVILITIIRSRNKVITIKYSKYDVFLLLIYIGYLAFLGLHFLKFPIFPNSSSGDYIIHLKHSLSLVKGEKTIVNLGYYPGVELLLGAGILLNNGENLVAMRHVMSILSGFAPILIYNTSLGLLKEKRKALICAAIYSFSSAFWYDSLYISGLYANMLTNLISIGSLYFIYRSTTEKKLKYYLILFLNGISLILSHSTSIVFIIMTWIFLAIIKTRGENLFKEYLYSVSCFSLPLLGIFFHPEILSRLKNILSGQYVSIELGDPIVNMIKPVSPFIAYMSGYMGIVLVSLTLTGCIFILIRTSKRTVFWSSFFGLWFIFIWILSLQGKQVWRFALLSKLPSVFLIGYLSEEVIASIEKIVNETQGVTNKVQKVNRYGLSLILVSIILISGGMLNYTSSHLSHSENEQRQKSIYESIVWVSENTDNGSKILVISEWEYIYLSHISHRESTFISLASDYNITKTKAVAEEHFDIIILSNALKKTIENEGKYTERWENDMVAIYQVPS